MSIDISSIIDVLSSLIIVGLLLLAVIRAVQIGRGLVSRVFRRRAFWMAVFGVFFLVAVLTTIPSFDTISIVNFLGGISFLLVFPVTFAFVDSSVLAAIEMDFFHRDTLRWNQFRMPFYVVPLALVILFILFDYYPNPPTWLSIAAIFLVVAFVVVFGDSVVTLIVASRRTPDRTMKRHVRLLGFALACLTLSIFIGVTFTGYPPLSLPELSFDFLIVVFCYLFYRAVMSLSPTSRIEKAA